MLFLSFLLILLLFTHVAKSLLQGLVGASDRLAKRAWGLSGVDDAELAWRRPRAVACWNYLQAVAAGALLALVLVGIRAWYASLGAEHWIYGLALLAWTLASGAGFKTHPGSVFVTCFSGVLLSLFLGSWGPAVAGAGFSLLVVPNYRRTAARGEAPRVDPSSVIVDVEAEH